ncbi:protein-L-isoaspartate O-methyltransferase family protein [Brevibacterium sp. FAM 25378]|uniref:protein-L-isoaspartate O-methyltransferase family protein n=1 Tax=unclassified Brevibacterium TaxID=2614124 RepID=UPI00109261D9|nr:methyltransferase domain-containing protein [Brevibacterium sp. S22]TGD31827.1 methyltransferase domain-containing protein [Brevibacterium sp. S22]
MNRPVRTVTLDRAFARVHRELFLPEGQRAWAVADVPLEIGCGQTNSQPSTVADMLELLAPECGDSVLDLGSGSGWTAALLAVIVGRDGRVTGVERHPELLAREQESVAKSITEAAPESGADAESGESPAPIEFVEARAGVLGAPDRGPFDRILVSAGADHLPEELVDQLVIGGVMVIPVGGVMLRVVRTGEEPGDVEVTRHGRYRFVPLIVE